MDIDKLSPAELFQLKDALASDPTIRLVSVWGHRRQQQPLLIAGEV